MDVYIVYFTRSRYDHIRPKPLVAFSGIERNQPNSRSGHFPQSRY